MIGLIYSSRRPAARARAGHPAAGAAAPARLVEHRVDADVEGHHGVVLRRRRDGHRLPRSSARWRCAWPTRSARSDEREAALREFDALLLRPGLDPVPVRRRAGVGRPRPAHRLEGRRGRRGQRHAPRAPRVQGQGVAGRPHGHQQGRQAGRRRWRSRRGPTSKPVVTDQLRAISGGWVSDKSLPEMGFTLGHAARGRRPRGAPAPRRRRRPARSRASRRGCPSATDGEVVGWTLDLMRRRDHGLPPGDGVPDRRRRRWSSRRRATSSSACRPRRWPRRPTSSAATATSRSCRSCSTSSATHARAVLRLPVAVRVQAEVPARAPPDVPRVPGRSTALAEIGIAVARAYMPDAGLSDWIKMTWDMVRRRTRTVDAA